MKLRVFNILKNTKVEGPGIRYCIWVQGCSRHCKGCQAVHTWSHNGGKIYETQDIIKDIFGLIEGHHTKIKDFDPPSRSGYSGAIEEKFEHAKSRTNMINGIADNLPIEGVTFLGGEPFEQAEALGEIAEAVQKLGLSVLCFTGGLLEDLRNEKKNQKLLENTDLLIDGPFDIEKIDYSRPWCGSSNQRYHFLTSRYNEEIFTKYKNKVEVNISKDGIIFMNGMGDFDKILQKIDLAPVKK